MEDIEEFIRLVDIRVILIFILILSFLLAIGMYGEIKRQTEHWDLPQCLTCESNGKS